MYSLRVLERTASVNIQAPIFLNCVNLDSYITSPEPGFFIYKMEMIIVPLCRVEEKIKFSNSNMQRNLPQCLVSGKESIKMAIN